MSYFSTLPTTTVAGRITPRLSWPLSAVWSSVGCLSANMHELTSSLAFCAFVILVLSIEEFELEHFEWISEQIQ